MTVSEVFAQCTINGNVVKLPTFQIENYNEVKRQFIKIGGKWKGGKTFGFVFESDPTSLVESVINGEKRDIKKEFQFFATPPELADKLVQLASFSPHWTLGSMNPSVRILEPSAGDGAIVKAIHRQQGEIPVYVFEKMDANRDKLKAIPNTLLGKEVDFLTYDGPILFDRIIANPPFSKNQDIDHIKKMYSLLKNGGVMVSISSSHWYSSSNKKECAFKEWLENVSASVEVIDHGAFKESGTMVGGFIIKIEK